MVALEKEKIAIFERKVTEIDKEAQSRRRLEAFYKEIT
jgi:hypothetical protein